MKFNFQINFSEYKLNEECLLVSMAQTDDDDDDSCSKRKLGKFPKFHQRKIPSVQNLSNELLHDGEGKLWSMGEISTRLRFPL